MTQSESIRTVAHRLTYKKASARAEEFRSLPLSTQGAVLPLLSPRIQQHLLEGLPIPEVVDVLDHSDLHQAQVMVGRIRDKARRKKIIERLKSDVYGKLEQFISFHPSATFSLLSLNYIYVPDTTTVNATADAIAEYRSQTGKFPEVLVHKNGELAGVVPLNVLIREHGRTTLKNCVEEVEVLRYNDDPKKTLDFFAQKPHASVVVLDNDGSVLGIIYADDVLALLEKQGAEALYDFAGVTESERPFDSVAQKVKRRWRWLVLNLATAFLAGGVVWLFEDVIAQIVVLAIYLPIIAGMGGNAATQSLAVMVRGISIGEVSLKNGLPAIRREVLAGTINGIIIGILVSIVAILWNQSLMLGVVIGVAMIINLAIAGFFGTLIPLVLKHMGKDPATSATIFITTTTDVLGFLAFLGLAALLLL